MVKKRSHNICKIHFTVKLTKTLTKNGKRVDFLFQPLNHVEFCTTSKGIIFPLKL